MSGKNLDLGKKKLSRITLVKSRGHNLASREIEIKLRIGPGDKPWWFYALIITVLMATMSLAYFVYFQDKWRKLNYEWGLQNLSEGKFEEASKNFEKASAGKNEAEAIYKLAVSKYNQKDYEGAAEAYQKALEKEPQNPSAYNGLANLYRDQKNFSLAREYYKKAAEADNSFVLAYSNWVIMLVDDGKVEEAKNVLAEGLEKNPGRAELGNLKKMLEE